MSYNPDCMVPMSCNGRSTALEYAIRVIDWCDGLRAIEWSTPESRITSRFMREFSVSRATAYRHLNSYRAARGLP